MKAFNKSSTAEQVTEGLDLRGKTFLLTGCNSGLGKEIMRVLALRGGRVLGAARHMEKASQVCADIPGDCVPVACDLSEPSSVKAAISNIQEPIDGIIANAGVMALQERQVKHGVELHMLINHMGHFMLVNGLLDQLTDAGRIVVTASAAHSFARGKNLSFEDLGWNRPYKPWSAYGYSKLANILFSRELARRLGPGQTTNSLHPGIIYTPLWRHLPEQEANRMKASYGFKSIEQGAATGIFLASHPSLSETSGAYFSNCAVSKASALGQDDKLATRLWELSEEWLSQF